MPTINVDLSNVTTQMEQVPPGAYPVMLTAVEERTGKSSGKPYLNWTFKILEGDSAGRFVWHTTSLSPDSYWNLKRTLEALGVDTKAKIADLDTSDLIGSDCVVVVVHKAGQDGVTRAQISNLYPAGSSVVDTVGGSHAAASLDFGAATDELPF